MNNLFMGLYGKIRLMKMALVETVSECHFEYGYLVGHDNMAVIFRARRIYPSAEAPLWDHCRTVVLLSLFYLPFLPA